ncbi:MAG: chromosomal replication initiator protein DnaA, partial [Rikenellaceae bacterium]|nr:chromosomal replication initiator protein DnaA [Rikenellaceae bacterium]
MILSTKTHNDLWENCLNRIREKTSPEEFERWFRPIVPLEFDGKMLLLKVPNESYVTHIEKNFTPQLYPIIQQLFGIETRVSYAIPRQGSVPISQEADTTPISRFVTQTDTANIKNPFVIPGIKKIVIDPQLNPVYTFDSFIEGECNRLARSAGLAVAVNPGKTAFNPLYIYGNSGLGKTHIAQAIGMEVRQRHPGMQV